MMRITNKMMVNSLNRNIHTNMLNMDKYMTQLSTTRRINKPSDDPAGIVKSLRLRTNLNEGEQFLANIDESLGFLDTTDAALNNVNEIMQKVRELTVKAATDSNAKTDFADIAKEIREMNEQLKMIANTTYGSKYIFAGSNVTEAPYQVSGWKGNQESLNAEISVGVVVPYNIDAKELFAGKTIDLSVDEASGINGDKIEIQNLQEGNYIVGYSVEDDVTGTAAEVNSSLNATGNNGMFFFYDNAGTPAAASIATGSSASSTASIYSGYLDMEVIDVHPSDDLNPALRNTLTVHVSGRIAVGNGEYQDIDITLDQSMSMNAGDQAAIITISAADLQATGLGLDATDDLVIWNNSGNALSGISAAPDTEFAVGDKVKVALSLAQANAQESQSYLAAVPNAGSFFYEGMGTAATLGVGTSVADGELLADNSPYSGSILVETTDVGPDNSQVKAGLNPGSEKQSAVITLDKPLYLKNGAAYTAITDGTDLKDYFTYQREDGTVVSSAISSAVYNATTGQINIEFDISQVQGGDVVNWNNDWDAGTATTVPGSGAGKLFYSQVKGGVEEFKEFKRVDENGNTTSPMEMSFNNSTDMWKYNENYLPQQLTVSVKAHLYTNDSNGKLQYKYVELNNVVIDPQTVSGQQIFTIPAAEIDDPDFTEDLVIWNNGSNSLGGIDPDNAQLKAGDKTVISFAAQGRVDSQNATIDFTYTSAAGEEHSSNCSLRFNDDTFDYQTQELKFFTLNEETGLAYSNDISLETGAFGPSDTAATFTWQEGLFSYMEDLARKIEAGKVTETSGELAGNDIRLQELLTHRSTIGARVNRLELQESRLESIQTTFTELLSKTEDANIAEVIMQLQLQENVYSASLAAGARIIQPTLIDFLS